MPWWSSVRDRRSSAAQCRLLTPHRHVGFNLRPGVTIESFSGHGRYSNDWGSISITPFDWNDYLPPGGSVRFAFDGLNPDWPAVKISNVALNGVLCTA
ncbi:hypothetical protein [Saccharothrix sp. S26]|uniref:hypothetical protein n=1 Tax=Saccharothrix sp. S26 TaxID=2907215 RepID=UPI001F15F517|nr:hypothetical protein [Saccharothrix sp. S26]